MSNRDLNEEQEIFLEMLTPAKSSRQITALKNKSFEEIWPSEIYTPEIFYKNKKQYLILRNPGGRPYSVDLLKEIIYCLQKTVEAVTDEDFIEIKNKIKTEFLEDNVNYPYCPCRTNKRTKTQGYIYVLKAVGQTHYKIGKTININKRMNQISPALPFKTKLIHTIPSNDITEAESILHEEFKYKRTNGEWFDLSKKDIDYLCDIESMEEL